jgi:hypothetical protein
VLQSLSQPALVPKPSNGPSLVAATVAKCRSSAQSVSM